MIEWFGVVVFAFADVLVEYPFAAEPAADYGGGYGDYGCDGFGVHGVSFGGVDQAQAADKGAMPL